MFTPGLAGLVLGRVPADGRRARAAPEAAPASRPIPELTARETEVLRLVATGMSYKEIAGELFLSHRTVQNHVQNTLGKLHLHNRVELVRFALAHGLEDERPGPPRTRPDRRGRQAGRQYRHAGHAGPPIGWDLSLTS